MRNVSLTTTIVAFVAIILTITGISAVFTGVSFAAMDTEGNRMIYPVQAGQLGGPSPWWMCDHDPYVANASSIAYNEYSKGPTTSHVLWTYLAGPGGAVGGSQPSTGYFSTDWMGNYIGDVGPVFGGRIFLSQGGAQYVSLDEDTGKMQWMTSDPTQYGYQLGPNFGTTGNENPFANLGRTQILRQSLMWVSGRNIYSANLATGSYRVQYTSPLENTGQSTAVLLMGWTLNVSMPGYQTRANELYEIMNIRPTGKRYSQVYSLRLSSPAGTLWGPVRADMPVAVKDDVVCCFEESYEGILRTFNRWTGDLWFQRMFDSYHSPTLGYDSVFSLGYDQHIYRFNYKTGALVWRSEIAMGNFGSENSISVGDGYCSNASYDGCIYVFKADTGEFVFRDYVGDCPYEFYSSYYGTWPFQTCPIGADNGKFYAMTGDHTRPWLPVPGETMLAVDGANQKEMWRLPAGCGSHGASMAIADGIFFYHDDMTSKVFAVSKGPSKVDVSVTKSQLTKGEYVWITGRITDQSAGQPGTPCVAKESMDKWMSYLHCTGPKPAFGEILGVHADLFATKSDGTLVEIGTVETDSEGYFKTIWTPADEDLYTITCSFAGDESYWDSFGTAFVAVGPATASMPLAPISVASIAAIVATCIVLISKRPFGKREEN